jgi:DNA-binding response OmpR family regulator
MTASLLLIDGDPSTSSSLRPALLQEGYRVATAEPGLDALRRMLAETPDLVILGVNCQRGDWEFCNRLVTFLDRPLLLLLLTSNPLDQVRALELGADDCMIRPVAIIEFLARIRALLRRKELFRQRAQRSFFMDDDLVVDLTRREVWLDGQPVALTPTEFQLLACLTQHAGEVLSYERLTMQVWGPDYSGARQAIKQYVHQLRAKLELNPRRPQRILTRRGEGYLFRTLSQS